MEVLENLAYLANASNLVLYLSQFMHFSPTRSANIVTNFMGTAFLLALLGGFLSDAFFTTYCIYLISAAIELMVIEGFLHLLFHSFIQLDLLISLRLTKRSTTFAVPIVICNLVAVITESKSLALVHY